MTRRQLVGLLAAAPGAVRRSAVPAPHQSAAQPPRTEAASLHESIAVIRKLEIPRDTEPAFSFQAQ